MTAKKKQAEEDLKFLDLAKQISFWSQDPQTKVGSVIVNSNNEVISTGYNSFADGVESTIGRWSRPEKYNWVVHAEVNAIFEAARKGVKLEGCTLYTTLFTCSDCADALIQSGIKRVCAPDYLKTGEQGHWWDNFEISKKKFFEAGIEVVLL